jgi:hypothetical protein
VTVAIRPKVNSTETSSDLEGVMPHIGNKEISVVAIYAQHTDAESVINRKRPVSLSITHKWGVEGSCCPCCC